MLYALPGLAFRLCDQLQVGSSKSGDLPSSHSQQEPVRHITCSQNATICCSLSAYGSNPPTLRKSSLRLNTGTSTSNFSRSQTIPRPARTHVGEAAPAVQGQRGLEAEHGLLGQPGALGRMHCMIGPSSNCTRLLVLCPGKLLKVHLRTAPLQDPANWHQPDRAECGRSTEVSNLRLCPCLLASAQACSNRQNVQGAS